MRALTRAHSFRAVVNYAIVENGYHRVLDFDAVPTEWSLMSFAPELAVTLVSGLRRSGKTTLATLLTGGQQDGRLDGIAGDELVDAHQLVVSLADHLLDMAEAGHRGDVVIELQPVADPAEIALLLEELFTGAGGTGSGVALREVITVARATDIRRLLFREGLELSGDGYDTSEQLATQLEFATAVVLTGIEACSAQQLREIHGLLTKLNPNAAIATLATAPRLRRRRSPSRTLAADLGRSMGWALELSGKAGPPTTLNTVSTLVFRDPRPFHPERLAKVVADCLEPHDVGLILRSRGLVRLASRLDRVGSWTSAGKVLAINPTSMLSWDVDSPVGQELVIIGRNLLPDRIARTLRAALLGDDELIAGPMEWANYADSFPAWQIEHDH